MISNVTAGNVSQIQAVIDSGLVPLVIDIIAKVTMVACTCSFFVAVTSEFTLCYPGARCPFCHPTIIVNALQERHSSENVSVPSSFLYSPNS